MERLQYICTREDDGLEVLTLLRRELRVSTNLLRQLKVTENGILPSSSLQGQVPPTITVLSGF